jgi:hypothetical protein
MTITPINAPPLPVTVPQDVVARTVTAIQAQAVTPTIQRAVDPSNRSDGGTRTRSNSDRSKGGDKPGGDKSANNHGGSVNIKV